MKRSGFKRPEYIPAPPAPPARGRMASMGRADLKAAPKPHESRNAHLLSMARGRPCLLRVFGVCNHNPATVVACHSNSSEHGKSMARKADDQWSVWGCSDCHRWLDQGKADYRTKNRAFSEAHLRQQAEWAKIVANMAEKPNDRRAAHWALALLQAGPDSENQLDALVSAFRESPTT